MHQNQTNLINKTKKMGASTLITYKGKNIYYMDFSNIKSEQEIAALITTCKNYIRSQPTASILTLADISNMHFNNVIKEMFTTFVKGNKPYVKAGVVVGISGLQSVIYNAIMKITGRNLTSMKSVAEAKEWLAVNG